MDKHLDPGMAGDYAEGILDPAARAIADAHLQGCADCRREVAAASAYFRDMSSLEPIQAPADFLAKVRARLPGEAPWRRALSAVLRPLRVVPVQLALATLIGITAVIVYVQQGGLAPESVVISEDARPTAAAPASPAMEPAPASAPAQSAPADITPASPEPVSKLLEKEAARFDARKSAPRPVAKDLAAQYAKVAEESDKLMGPAGSGAATKSRPISDVQPLKGTADGPLAGIAADADRALAREKKSAQPEGQGTLGSRRDSPRPVAKAGGNEDAESLDMPMSETAQAPASSPAQAGRAREILANTESPAAKPAKTAPAPKAKAERASASPEAAAANESAGGLGYSDDGFASSSKENTGARSESRAAAKPKADAGTRRRAAPTEPASAPSPAPAPALRQEEGRAVLTLKLRALKDTTALFAGLKSMGVRAEPAAIPAGSPWIRRHLEAAPSMIPDMQEYLRRYGYLTGTVGDPSGPAPARIDLLIVKP